MKNSTLNSTLILMLGDAVIFGFFAIGGRETHAAGDANLIVNALPTLLTFLLIWIAVARLIGVWRAAIWSSPTIPLPFILATLGLNGSLLLLWHGGYAWWRVRHLV